MAAMAVVMPVAASLAVGPSGCRHSAAGTSTSSSAGAPAILSSHGAPVRGGYAASAFMRGQELQRRLAVSSLQMGRKVVVVKAQAAEVETEPDTERLRLNNLSPQPGSRHRQKRKGRGIAAGKGASCGFGMRGQKSRSGSGVRPGFEGGQMPLYRRLPKLKGIAGGMGAGLPNFVTVNLGDIAVANFSEGEEVSLESLTSRRIINPSGRDSKLRLKVLGEGELTTKVTIKAGAFSKSAKEKLEMAGITMVDVPGRRKWVRPSVAAHQERAIQYFAEKKAAGNWIEK